MVLIDVFVCQVGASVSTTLQVTSVNAVTRVTTAMLSEENPMTAPPVPVPIMVPVPSCLMILWCVWDVQRDMQVRFL